MDYSQAVVERLMNILLYKVENLPDNPFKNENWELDDSPHE